MQELITKLYDEKPEQYDEAHFRLLDDFLAALNSGQVRACNKINAEWKVNLWVKQGILLAFRMGKITGMDWSDSKHFFDKHTLPEKQFSVTDQIRIVPGGTSIRTGCYIAKGVTVMPPAYVNIGAYIDSGTMVDSHALVGSCAQVGKNVHLSAAAILGGVLEPIGKRPVIIEDDVFIGGNTGIYEGILVRSQAVIAPGTILTASTPVYDYVHKKFLEKAANCPYEIPSGAVVVPGSRKLRESDFHVYCPVIIKYRDANTNNSITLEQELRNVVE